VIERIVHEFGFDKSEVEAAYERFHKDEELTIEFLLNNQFESIKAAEEKVLASFRPLNPF
jgi:hypothetical protein